MRLLCVHSLLFLLVPLCTVWANQLPSALLESIYPPSGTQGTKVDLTIKGTFLEGAHLLQFSAPSIKATPKKNEEGEVVANAFVVEIPPDLAVGRYSVSVGGGKFGHSNGRSFIVNDLPEIPLEQISSSMESAKEVKLGHTMVGFPKASNYGWMKIALKAKQKVVIESEGRHTDSQFSSCLAVFDESGRKLGSSTRTGFLVFEPKQDGTYSIRLHDFLFKGGEEYLFRLSVTTRPRIHFIDPPLVRIGKPRKALVYGWNLPGGKPAGLDLPGNLPLERLETSIHLASEEDLIDPLQTRDPIESTQPRHDYRLSSPAGNSLPFSLVVCPDDWTKEILESEAVVELTPPSEFLGSFFPARDRDRFRFEAKKGESFKMEVFCERMGFPSHPYLLVEQVTTKDDGSETRKTVAQSDKTEHPSTSPYLYLSSRDPSLRFSAPSDGIFEVLVYDMFRVKGNPFKSYRFSIRRESPDFGLMAHPFLPPPANNKSPVYQRSPTIRPGQCLPIRVAVNRKDGFEGEIKLTVKGLPQGIDYFPRVLPKGENSVVILFRADKLPAGKQWSGKYSIIGTAMLDGKAVVRSCGIANLCWSQYNTQSKLALSKLRMGEEGTLAFLPGREAPINLAVNWKKMAEQSEELIEKTEKAIKALTKSEAKTHKAKDESEKKATALVQPMEVFIREKQDKEKRVKLLVGSEIPKAQNVLKLVGDEIKKAEAKKSQKEIPADQLASIEDSIKKVKSNLVVATSDLKRLTDEQAKINQSLKSTYSAAELKKRKLALSKAEADLEKNSYAWNKEKAKLASRKKVLARAKLKENGFAQRIKDPGNEPLVLVTALGGALTLPVSLEAKDKAFATPTKVRVMGMTAAAKIKEITIDPKKKKDGDLAINLTQAKFPQGEFNLICLAQGKGKYKLYDELEKNATELEAKEIGDSFAALKKEVDEAGKKLENDKKNLTPKKAELNKAMDGLVLLEKELAKQVVDLKKAEESLAKELEAIKKEESLESINQAKLTALKKSKGELEKSVASLEQKNRAHLTGKIEPGKAKKELAAKTVLQLEESVAKAQLVHSDLSKRLKQLETRKKKTDARLKLVKDDFAKPKDFLLAHFDLPFVLRVKKAPFVFEDFPSLALQPGGVSSLPVQIDRDNDFEDPINLKLILPKGVKGITMKSQNIEKSECLGEIQLSSEVKASEGKHSCTVEATFKYKNQNLKLSQSFELMVLPTPKKPS